MFLGLIKIVGLPIIVVKHDFIMKIFEFSLYLTIHSKIIQARTTYAFSLPHTPSSKEKDFIHSWEFSKFSNDSLGFGGFRKKKEAKV